MNTNKELIYRLSKEQEGLWFLQQLDPTISAYNVVFGAEINGELNLEKLKQTFNFLIKRHEVLNTKFKIIDGVPHQCTSTSKNFDFDIEVNTSLTCKNTIKSQINLDSKKPFDLSKDLLIRANIYSQNDNEHVLVITAHHIAMDLWSLAILLNELQIVYNALSNNETPILENTKTTFQNHVEIQESILNSEKGDSLREFWNKKLSGDLPILDFPIDKTRPKVLTYNGDVIRFTLDRALSEKLVELAKKEGVTLYMLLLAAYKVLVHRYSNQEDILVGAPVAGRNQKATRNIIGNFVNTIVLKSTFDASISFSDFVKSVRNNLIEGIKHQEYPFSQLVKDLQPDRDPGRAPLIQTAFAWERLPVIKNIETQLNDGENRNALNINPFDVNQQEGQFELSLEMGNELNGELHGLFKYNTDLFEKETIAQVVSHFKNLLKAITETPEQTIAKLPLMSKDEQEEILTIWKEKPQKYPQFNTLHEGFEAMVAKNPEAIAAVLDQTEVTYDELNKKANALARHLIDLGVEKGTLVGMCVNRTIEMLIGIMGVLKAGGAYVPLDPKNPKERLALILEDSKVPIVLTQGTEELIQTEEKVIKVDLEKDWEIIDQYDTYNLNLTTGKEELAYVIYTSGSTGKPKGVLNTHHNVLRLYSATDHWYKFNENDVWSLFHTYAFDVSVWEIWGALLHGGKLAVVSYETSRTPELFYQLLVDKKVTVLSQTPSAFKQLVNYETSLDSPKALSLGYVVFGGEALDIPALKPWIDRHGDQKPQLINMYGITETTVHTTFRKVTKKDLASPKSMVGQPITDMKIHLLDNEGNPVPYGVTGEIYVGGEGLAVKYLNRPELTAERFITDPFSNTPGARLYKSGDLAQLYKNGDMKYVGRADTQVKIRGFRIELGEIQTLLAQHESIKNAVVTVKNIQNSDQRIVAYYTTEEGTKTDDKTLRNYLTNRLPDYMVPSVFMKMEQFALTNNGKIDYRKLPTPEIKRDNSELVPARDVVELELQKIWERTLSIAPIGVTDDFFHLGGHSMLAVNIMSDVKLLFGENLPISVLFQYPTIEKLAEVIRDKKEVADNSALVQLQKGNTDKQPIFCMHPIGGNVFCYTPMVESIENDRPVYALQVPFLYQEGTPHVSVEDLATDYIKSIKSMQENGPYNLAGYCFGGLIATEAAHQLIEAGEEIASLTLLDTRSPLYEEDEEFDDAVLLSWFARDLALPYGKTLTIDPEEFRKFDTVEEMFDLVMERAKKGQIMTDDINYEQVYRYLQVYVANGAALALYEAKPFPGRINLLRATEEPLIESIGINLGWDRIGVEDLRVYDVPGDHNTMMYQPNAAVLAKNLQSIVQQREPELELT
ncbi:amino acid adenylation domain-containing protein [Aquimarina sp. 2201CG5-10]|uniref:non-ribosomal peptide synthetase n=1 Tax=Aquimarina callyspongiae TaxID=3098150 RepID=UPI002AB4039E|nr:amino acid adenylation domain-containing protein [Aquimarina sp. 2201CG5-10]MDY8138354.1 amino acid adenylation domain-containing protein [Aquimarina sp. 2201CG5-10]